MNALMTSIRFLVIAAGVVMLSPAPRLTGQASGVRMLVDEGEAARYWARWRGPSGQGVVTGTGYPDRWSATQNVLWKVRVAGNGNSSPIVWRDRVLLTTAQQGGSRLSLLAFRRSDGGHLWEAVVPPGRSDSPHSKNGNASATPATDGVRVYVSFGSRGLFAFDLDGKLLWQRDLGRIGN